VLSDGAFLTIYQSVGLRGANLTICMSVVSWVTFTSSVILFPGMVQVSGEFPKPWQLAGHIGPTSVSFLFGFPTSDVLAAFG